MNNSKRMGCTLVAAIYIAINLIALGGVLGNLAGGGTLGTGAGILVGLVFGALIMFLMIRQMRMSNRLQESGDRYIAQISNIYQRNKNSWIVEAWYNDKNGQLRTLQWNMSYLPWRRVQDGSKRERRDIATGNVVDVLISKENPNTYSMDLRKTYEDKVAAQTNLWR